MKTTILEWYFQQFQRLLEQGEYLGSRTFRKNTHAFVPSSILPRSRPIVLTPLRKEDRPKSNTLVHTPTKNISIAQSFNINEDLIGSMLSSLLRTAQEIRPSGLIAWSCIFEQRRAICPFAQCDVEGSETGAGGCEGGMSLRETQRSIGGDVELLAARDFGVLRLGHQQVSCRIGPVAGLTIDTPLRPGFPRNSVISPGGQRLWLTSGQ